jgi:2',3'-cyclic-nucleotide 2'-phosphodiesterase (5'-nucleotidase family)
MKLLSSFLMVFLAISLLTACSMPANPMTTPALTALPSSLTPVPPSASPLPASIAPAASPQASDSSIRLTVLYTADEHGWMSGQESGQGAAELLGLWQQDFSLGQDPGVIVLSGGDNWTGPAISTWFDGEGMVEVMNQMGYAASAVGNHEFDFGLDVLQARLDEADFPYLSANLRRVSDGAVPTDLGIQPYVILAVNGVQVGVIGLSATYTPLVANPAYLSDFEFIPYEDALREYVPQMRAAGAQVILLLAHICPDELEMLSLQVADLGISLMGGGHCHVPYARRSGDTALIASAANLAGFAWARLAYDPASGQAAVDDLGVTDNQDGQPDPRLAGIIAGWQVRTDAELDVQIGYLTQAIEDGSQAMQDLITESWLWGYPNADIAFTNLGGMRADLPAGPLTIADLISVMPFNNTLVEVHLSGAQVISVLAAGRGGLAVGGMHRQVGAGWVLDRSGEGIDPEQIYSVLVNDYMYAGGDGYTILAEADPSAYQTGIDWRQPVIDWIVEQGSTVENPLDAAIAGLGD